jgi:hypothetical protein
MTLIVDALDRIARECGVKAPSSWVTATQNEHLEIRDDFLRQTIDDIADRVDLPFPVSDTQTFTGGAGTTEADGSERFDIRSNFVRMHLGELAVYDPQQDRPVIPVSDDGLWTYITDQGAAGVVKYYKITGFPGNYDITFYNPPGTGHEITIHYMTNKWMVSGAGSGGSEFTDDTDQLSYPRRVVEAGTVWRFRERRGLPYMDRYNEYEALIARLSNTTRQRKVVNMGGINRDVRWQDLVPSWIPNS